MSLLRLIFVSFLHHWRMNLAVALGAAAGTAVLTGALLVGDSMRGSLRALTLDRLGKIDEVLAPGRFFREKLADELKETNDYKEYGESLVPAILLPASMENPNTQNRANRVEVIGCKKDFSDLFLPSPSGSEAVLNLPSPSGRGAGGEGREIKNLQSNSTTPSPHPNPLPKGEGTANAREIDLNQPLAEKLGVKPGDAVILRLPRPGVIPSDSALGEKRDTVRSYRLTVHEILPAAGLGRFSLKPSQQEPLNAYVPLDWLQERLEQPGKVNTLLLGLNEIGEESIERYWLDTPPKITLRDVLSRVRAIITGRNQIQSSSNVFSGGIFLHWSFPLDLSEDLGLRIAKAPKGYVNLTADSMIIPPGIEAAIDNHEVQERMASSVSFFPEDKDESHYVFQRVFTYLANSVSHNGRDIPYSTITAIDFSADPPLGPFLSPDGKPVSPLADNEIALNTWAAEDLAAKIGDRIKVCYFEPESSHGQIREKTAEFRLAAIVQLGGAADDRNFTPSVKGITNIESMSDWDPPFPFDAKRIRPTDEKYWKDYGPTPKAFVSLAAGRELWGNRFGQTTSVRMACKPGYSVPDSFTEEKFFQKKLQNWLQLGSGFFWQTVKLQALAAAQGTTPFNVLFLGFSFFIIVSALMLVLLLFKLGVERRAAEIGILLAVGWKPKKVRKLLFREGVLTALGGGLLGVPLGIGYAALMLWGLQTWWLAAIVTPFLKLYIAPGSLMIGFFAGFFMGVVTIFFAVRKISRIAPRQLLAGLPYGAMPTPGAMPTLAVGMRRAGKSRSSRISSAQHAHGQCGHDTDELEKPPHPLPLSQRARGVLTWIDILWIIFFSANLLFWLFARRLSDLEAGLFFGSGAIVLLLTLLVIWNHLRRGATGAAVAVGGGNLFRLAVRNAARNPGRSTLTIGLVASACFLIVAVSAFQLDPSQQTPTLESGNGGFALAAESSQPIFQNLDTPDGRAAIGFSDAEEKSLSLCRIYSLRVRAGDDASCLNLYKSHSPRILGLPQDFLARGGFTWADAPTKCENPWRLLEPRNLDVKAEVPMILEKNTANYSLNLWGGLGEQYWLSDRSFGLRVAALLDNSIFQGDLLISEEALLEKFPETAGYRFFLVECPREKTAEVQKILENRLGDYGFAAETTGRRLARFLAVQNTYLSTFQSLGGLGLLLGTLGLAAVQLRNVLERRGELALLRAVGFRQRKLAWLVLLENAVLLVLGTGSGVLAALVAVMPHFLSTGASIPWLSLTGTLGLVLLVGMLAGLAAVRQTLKAPLLNALREDR